MSGLPPHFPFQGSLPKPPPGLHLPVKPPPGLQIPKDYHGYHAPPPPPPSSLLPSSGSSSSGPYTDQYSLQPSQQQQQQQQLLMYTSQDDQSRYGHLYKYSAQDSSNNNNQRITNQGPIEYTINQQQQHTSHHSNSGGGRGYVEQQSTTVGSGYSRGQQYDDSNEYSHSRQSHQQPYSHHLHHQTQQFHHQSYQSQQSHQHPQHGYSDDSMYPEESQRQRSPQHQRHHQEHGHIRQVMDDQHRANHVYSDGNYSPSHHIVDGYDIASDQHAGYSRDLHHDRHRSDNNTDVNTDHMYNTNHSYNTINNMSHHTVQNQNNQLAGLREPTNTVWLGGGGTINHNIPNLYRIFGEFGKVMRVSRLESKNVIFIHFRTPDEATMAIHSLAANQTLGKDIRYNYGKYFTYSPEEMSAPYDPLVDNASSTVTYGDGNSAMGRKREREGDTFGGRVDPEPSNVLYVGEIPANITMAALEEHFRHFRYRNISRNEHKGICFIHFDAVEQCRQCLEGMRGVPMKCGAMLRLNFGTAKKEMGNNLGQHSGGNIEQHRADAGVGYRYDGGDMLDRNRKEEKTEIPTNVIFVGNLSADTTSGDLDVIFKPFEGYMNSRVLEDKGFGFGHFETVDHAKAARVSLGSGPTPIIRGMSVRITYGNSNHKQLAQPPPINTGSVHDTNDMFSPQDTRNGALVASILGPELAMALLPEQGARPASGAMSVAEYLKRRRDPPKTISMSDRIRALMSTPYNSCGETDRFLKPNVVALLCDYIDETVDEASGAKMESGVLKDVLPLSAAHVGAVIAKRLKEYFDDNLNKKMHVMYALMRAVFKSHSNLLCYSKPGVEAVLCAIFVASERQTSDEAVEGLRRILEKFTAEFLTKGGAHCRFDDDFNQHCKKLVEQILEKCEIGSDLAMLLKKRRKK